MDFIDFEAVETDQQNDELIFSHNEIKDSGKVDDNFIDDTEQETSEPSFYRQFVNQTKDPQVAIYKESDDETFLDTRDLQPELYAVKNREKVIFDEFTGYEIYVQKFRKALSPFDDNKTENSFSDAVIYGFLFKLSQGKSLTKGNVESVLGRSYYGNFCDVKNQLKLDLSMYGFLDKCALANELPAKNISF